MASTSSKRPGLALAASGAGLVRRLQQSRRLQEQSRQRRFAFWRIHTENRASEREPGLTQPSER